MSKWRYETRAEVAAKVDYEGGLADVLDYGLYSGDMPDGDDELIAAWQLMEIAYQAFDLLADKVRDLLPDAWEDD